METTLSILDLTLEELYNLQENASEIRELNKLITHTETSLLNLEDVNIPNMAAWVDVQRKAAESSLSQYVQRKQLLMAEHPDLQLDKNELSTLLEQRTAVRKQINRLLAGDGSALELITLPHTKTLTDSVAELIHLNAAITLLSSLYPDLVKVFIAEDLTNMGDNGISRSGPFKLELFDAASESLPEELVILTRHAGSAKQLFMDFLQKLMELNPQSVRAYLASTNSTQFHLNEGEVVLNYHTSMDSYNRTLHLICKKANLPILKLVKCTEASNND